MEMQPDEIDVRELRGMKNHLLHVSHRDSELVLGIAGGDVRVRMGTDVGIDAESHVGGSAASFRQSADYLQFRQTLHIETAYTEIETEIYLPVAFADSGIDYAPGRESCLDSSLDFAAADAVGAKARFPDYLQNLRVRVSLDRIMHMVSGIIPDFGFYGL